MLNVPFILVGAGEHGKVVLDVALAAGVSIAAIIDDAPTTPSLRNVKVAKLPEEVGLRSCFQFLVAIGSNCIRARIFLKLVEAGNLPQNIVHPFSYVSSQVELDKGNVVCAGVVVNPGARIGENCILNTSCSVDHDCVIGNHVHICPGVRLAGSVSVGDRTMIGSNSVIIPGVKIGASCMIGAGSVVVADIPDNTLAFGNPARIRRRLEGKQH